MSVSETKTEGALDVDAQLSARLAQLGQEHCIFSRHGQVYALSVSTAREVLMSERVTPVPRAPATLVGVLNLRGEVLPLVYLDALLQLPFRAYGSDDQVLVLASNNVWVGIVVDKVRDVRPINPKEVTAVPASIPIHPVYKSYWNGTGDSVIILDGDTLVAAATTLVSRGLQEATEQMSTPSTR